MMKKNSKIYVSGNAGMVGSAIVRALKTQGFKNIVTRTHKELDLLRQEAVEDFFGKEKPEYVFHAAAKVGGIGENIETPADFLYENLMMEINVIHAAWENGCKKLVFLASKSIYPKNSPQFIKEDYLLTSALDLANEGYALGKIAGLRYCEFLNKQYGLNYVTVVPCNLYGPNDNYNPGKSHVVPSFIRRFHESKEKGLPCVTCWGDGSTIREFMYVDDLAELCVFLMNHYKDGGHINAGTGEGLSIRNLAELVAKVVGFSGDIQWDATKPNGTSQKLLDISKTKALGWTYKILLEAGLHLTYQDFLDHLDGGLRTER